MKWFKHISDSIHDPFIYSLIKEFGSDGYLVFFGVLEIYAREFSTEISWKLDENLSYFSHNFLISSSKFKKILSKITKWEVVFYDDRVSVFIPKFKELMDESTIKKLREKSESFRNRSGTIPKSEATDVDVDVDSLTSTNVDVLPPTTNGGCPHHEIISLYHENLPMCPTVKEWNDTRQAHLRARWKSSPNYQNLAWWEGFFQYIAKSKFLTGKVTGKNGKPFVASLAWIVKPENFVKIREGNYE